jgi:hypothetical protein
MRARIELTTAAYYRAQQLPVLMVRYVAPTRRLYARWFHESTLTTSASASGT